MGLSETKNIKIASFDFITENWALVPNGPAVSKTHLQHPKTECDVTQQQNQNKLPEGCLFMKCRFVCLDIDEQDGFGSTLSRVSEVTLPPHESGKALADQFASFFHNKIKIIRDTFIPSGTEKDVHTSSDPPKIIAFTEVPQDTVNKIIRNSPKKSCLLDPWPTFLIK